MSENGCIGDLTRKKVHRNIPNTALDQKKNYFIHLSPPSPTAHGVRLVYFVCVSVY